MGKNRELQYPQKKAKKKKVYKKKAGLHKHWDEFRLAVDCVIQSLIWLFLQKLIFTVTTLTYICYLDSRAFFYTRDKKRGGDIGIFQECTIFYSDITVSYLSFESPTMCVFTYAYDVYLLALYRSPSESAPGFLSELRNCLQPLLPNSILCITGHININLLKPIKLLVCEYLTLLADYGVVPCILARTSKEFYVDRHVSWLTDYINMSAPSSRMKSAIITKKLSDHYFIAAHLGFPGQVSTEPNTHIRRLEIVDNGTFNNHVFDYDWATFHISEIPSDTYNYFVQLFRQFSNTFKDKTVMTQASWCGVTIFLNHLRLGGEFRRTKSGRGRNRKTEGVVSRQKITSSAFLFLSLPLSILLNSPPSLSWFKKV